MSLVYFSYGKECVLHRDPCLMVCLYLSIIGMCRTFAQMLKCFGLIWFLKAFMLNSLSLWCMSMLKYLDLYMLVTVWSS